jgi:hypothetical protein
MNCYSEPSHDCEAIYIGLWGTLIVMTWLQFGGATVYVPAHARPPILARMLASPDWATGRWASESVRMILLSRLSTELVPKSRTCSRLMPGAVARLCLAQGQR